SGSAAIQPVRCGIGEGNRVFFWLSCLDAAVQSVQALDTDEIRHPSEPASTSGWIWKVSLLLGLRGRRLPIRRGPPRTRFRWWRTRVVRPSDGSQGQL